ncbi:MAG: HlyD family efflux transporter periplasmic adaptor subunit [Chloroflexota bacterium]|nr:HlyD family efflux transporter periplasmic adaptor subunit [Chloroflexota bacterium]
MIVKDRDATTATDQGHPQANGNGDRDGHTVNDLSTMPQQMLYNGGAVTPARRRGRLIVPLLLLAVLAAGVGYFLLSPSKGVTTTTVHKGTIVSSVQTTGKLEAAKSARLVFKSSGLVTRVVAQVGDKVKAGDLLAETDTAALQRELTGANVQLQISKLRLQQAKEGVKQSDVDAATADLNAAVAQLDQLKAGSRSQDITAAQAKFEEAKAARDGALATASNAREQARLTLALAQNALKNAQDLYSRIKADNAKTSSANLTSDQKLAQDKAERDVQDAQSKVSQAQSGYDTAKLNEIAQRSGADAQLNDAQALLDKVKQGPTPQDITTAQSKVDAARATLSKVKAGPTTTDLAILQQGVELAQVGVDKVNAMLADSRLIAPFSGTILSIDLHQGETAPGMQTVATIADTASLRIKGDVDEIDVGRVTAGQPVTVTLDAYPGVKLPGKIESLAPGATLKGGSTVYQATISFTATEGVVPREGMAANVDITAQRKDNVLLLPNQAFEKVGSKQFVSVRSPGGSTSKVEVETGLSNSTETEVISGVSDGQVIALK